MALSPLTVVDTHTVLALLHSSARSGAARILRVLGLVARAAELDARRSFAPLLAWAIATPPRAPRARTPTTKIFTNIDTEKPPCSIALRA
jgi:hypothetical protein